MLNQNRSKPRHMPNRLNYKKQTFYYDGISDVTGDVFYAHAKDDGTIVRILVTNPRARSRQLEWFQCHA